jgi:hypothetical protein
VIGVSDEDGVSRAAMLDLARLSVGDSDPDRRLTDWVELGLVPGPRKRGLGRGRGTVSGWSEFAAGMWRTQLKLRSAGLDIASLCNTTVGFWIYEISPIETTQVSRALHTWAVRRTSRRSGHLRASAERAISRAAHPFAGVAVRRQLRALLEEIPTDLVAVRQIPPLVREVVAPGVLGSEGKPSRRAAKLFSIEVLAQRLGAQLVVRAGRNGLPKSVLEQTRALVLKATIAQASNRAAAAVARSLGAPDPPMSSDRVGLACLDMAQALGMVRLRELDVIGGSPNTRRPS